MKVTIISGSPRAGQNCEKLTQKAIEYFNDKGYETDKILLSKTTEKYCIHCNACSKKNSCIHDDETNKVNEKLSTSDAIIFITPVYFGNMSAQMKTLIDKTLPLRRNGFKLKGKIGTAVAVGGSRNGGQEIVIQGLHAAMLIHGMIIVGDNSHFGGTFNSPVDDDEFGNKTLAGTFEAVHDALKRINGK